MPPTALRTAQEWSLHDLWRSLVIFDLALLWRIQDVVRRWPPWMQRNLARVVSRQPLRDISMVTWFAFSLGCYRFGFHFFWACCTNLLVAGFVRLLVGAPRPFMFDLRLRPITDRYETSHGFPSLETHMATVVVGWWVESINAPGGAQSIARFLAAIYICFVGFTRLVLDQVADSSVNITAVLHGTLTAAKLCDLPKVISIYVPADFMLGKAFITIKGNSGLLERHDQIGVVLFSMITGAIGLLLGWRLSVHLDSFHLLFRHHVRGTIVVLIIALGFVSYHVENNTSELMGIKKQEYVRVLANIINESAHTQTRKNGTIGAAERDSGDSLWEKEPDASTDGRVTSSRSSRRRLLEERRDSFFFLHKTIERRAAEKAAVQRNHSTRDPPSTSRGGSFDGEIDGVGSYGERRGTGRRRHGKSECFSAAAGHTWGGSVQ